jgi:hypothetical protein
MDGVQMNDSDASALNWKLRQEIRKKLIEVADRCSGACAPSTSIDHNIYLLQRGVGKVIPQYTRSLDAALSLIPEGHDYILEHVNGGLTIGARVGHNDPDRTAWGDTAALAMCNAALRAQANLV